MPERSQGPLIVQSDRTILLETAHPRYEEARDSIARFAELEKSPEHIHTYRLSPLSLWNAAAAGLTAVHILAALDELSKYPVPQNVRFDVEDIVGRYGKLRLVRGADDRLVLESDEAWLLEEISRLKAVEPCLDARIDARSLAVRPGVRGALKQALIKAGFPVEDLAGYVDGAPLAIELRHDTIGGRSFVLRHYQEEAVRLFHANGSNRGGSGVIVLPCGAGKTIVGLGVMAKLQTQTLILTANVSALRQWRDEILDKTDLTADQVGEYSGHEKEIRPVTLSTYQLLTYRRGKDEEFLHFKLFAERDWGLIIYDEVHLLPAPVFRATAELQARRRLGLTATLVREDGGEDDVFTLIGPKRYDIPWKDLERQGWIATARCTEIRIPLTAESRRRYAVADARAKFRISSTNPLKRDLLATLLAEHRGDKVLVIGQYIDQLEAIAADTGAPLITGKTPQAERDSLYEKFRGGELGLLIVSKVSNFAIDLPDANVAIQVSGTFGSRQEEAQRLGRILRPKADANQARFYALVTRDTRDQEFAQNRQRFLTEQGYQYEIRAWTPMTEGTDTAGDERSTETA
ncbi:MAG TPA: DNA repair helicase XPB [Candidatus Binatia bacterium]|nr:DNA repair helicase XPB [Candidatus Binatia bacterium]